MERASAKLAAAFQVVFDTTSEQVDTDTGKVTPPEVENCRAACARWATRTRPKRCDPGAVTVTAGAVPAVTFALVTGSYGAGSRNTGGGRGGYAWRRVR
ncbi:hypothetical protein HEK616_06620 [Streptomyces nigrescens]|uniref:Uncharacterized protein n=1 Tax=Streptomyces nigrescens TaxID=1920 RepID=A0ABM7ZLA4_STRNI|nr:hypothetical protein HEK616_06620 [Streptomyces nigrescens]